MSRDREHVKLVDAQWEWNPQDWPRRGTPAGACIVYSRSAYCAARQAGSRLHPELQMWDCIGKHAMLNGTREPVPPVVQIGILLTSFHTMVVRDGLDPQAVHREFLKINEYRRVISPDCEGAEP